MNRVRKQVKCKDDIQRNIATEEIAVAILDTGIGRHPDFGKRILTFVDFVNGRQASYDDSGHGTHVAGCVGGNGYASHGLYKGIAPACRLCVGKVLDQNGEGCVESMHRGLEWVLKNYARYQIRVLNVSLGIGSNGEMEHMEGLVELLDAAWEEGIVVVCAAGNNGPREGTISPLGCSRRVITVGCHEGGYFGARKNVWTVAKNTWEKGLTYAYRDRKNKKRNFRALWIQRINAAARLEDLSYSRLMGLIHKAGIEINRKVLADLAVNNPAAFKAIVDKVKNA